MFRFTIRDVLWLTLVAALSMAWFRDRASHQARQLEAARIHHEDMHQLRVQIDALKEDIAAREFRSKYGVDPPPNSN